MLSIPPCNAAGWWSPSSTHRQTYGYPTGTAVLGLLAGQPGDPSPGLIPDARFRIVNVFTIDSEGRRTAGLDAVLSALEFMENAGAQVALLDLSGPDHPLLRETIARLHAKGMLFVALAGDQGPGRATQLSRRL